MQELYNKIKHISLENAIEIENKDRQFLALQELFQDKKIPNNVYLFLVIANSLICYQLSGKGEDYWEEFSLFFKNKNLSFETLVLDLSIFIKQSKNNKRFVETKIKRLEKISHFYLEFSKNPEFFYKNMDLLASSLAKTMNQKQEDKTIVFAIKMFSYAARNIFTFQAFPKNLMIPLDSRLEKIFERYKEDEDNIKIFYLKISEKLDIPLLHLDAILWVNYEEIMS